MYIIDVYIYIFTLSSLLPHPPKSWCMRHVYPLSLACCPLNESMYIHHKGRKIKCYGHHRCKYIFTLSSLLPYPLHAFCPASISWPMSIACSGGALLFDEDLPAPAVLNCDSGSGLQKIYFWYKHKNIMFVFEINTRNCYLAWLLCNQFAFIPAHNYNSCRGCQKFNK